MALVVSCEPNGGLTSTANVVGNRPASWLKLFFGGPICRPFRISLKGNVICLDITMIRVKPGLGIPNCAERRKILSLTMMSALKVLIDLVTKHYPLGYVGISNVQEMTSLLSLIENSHL